MTRRSFVIAGALAAAPLRELRAASDPAFLSPPWEARPSTYWVWLNGFSDPERITYELEELKKAGVNAAYILEIGARAGDAVPSGPAYFSSDSLKAISHAVREAGRLGIDIGITNASSWNAGGAWVTPEHASKGLYWSRINLRGPKKFSSLLPFPNLPAAAPRKPDGSPALSSEVALLAVPAKRRLPGFDFLFDIGPGVQTLTRIALHNASPDTAVKDFALYASISGADAGDFKEIFRGVLENRTGPQNFPLSNIAARYLKLRVASAHNPTGRVALAEFQAFSPGNFNVVTVQTAIGSKISGGLLSSPAEAGLDREWMAENIYDNRLTGPNGSWAADLPLPAWIDRPNDSIDLTSRLDPQGRLDWDVPPGEWDLYRFITANNGEKLKAPSPKSAGLIIDHLSAEAARMHNSYMLDKLTAELGDLRNTALKYFYSCSYEARGSIWTPNFELEFRRRRGYDIRPYLPVLAGAIVIDQDASTRFRTDYKRTVSDLFIDNFYRASRETVSRHGLKLVSEAGGPGLPLHPVPVDALGAQGALDIPRGEFWKNHSVWVAKETASAAHIYGQRLVQMESFTSFRHWQDGPRDLKEIADRALCDGANHFVWHTMPHAPGQSGKPGWVYHAGTHFGPNETWWPMVAPFLDYLARCSWMLRQGIFAADVCYYYGERGYNFGPEKTAASDLGIPPGYDFDAINTHALLTRLTVKNRKWTLPDGLSYSVLCLPAHSDLDPEVLERIGQGVQQGAILCGPRPRRATTLNDYPRCDGRVRDLSARIWGSCDGVNVRENSYGRGKVYWGVPLDEVLRANGLAPDFSWSTQGSETSLDYIHRRDGPRDIYFIRNRRDEPSQALCSFRVPRRAAAELLDPVSGGSSVVAANHDGARASIPLSLPPFGSTFVLFAPDTKAPSAPAARTAVPQPVNVEGSWDIEMTHEGRKLQPGSLNQLISWTEYPDPDIKYFSGIATYSKTINIPAGWGGKDRRLYLDLGDVQVIARLHINGKEAGICWTRPFRVDITQHAVAGANQVRIEVANTWSNRITGDMIEKRPRRTNARWSPTARLLPSGLLGPVRLVSE